MPSGPITVLLVSDSCLIGDGLRYMLAGVPDVVVSGWARSQEEMLDLVRELKPDCAIVSIRNPAHEPILNVTTARALRVSHPALGIVVISERSDAFTRELLRDGGAPIAYLLDDRLPSMEAVIAALRSVHAGRTILNISQRASRESGAASLSDLSPREIEVLERIAAGLSNRAIAAELFVSVKSVEKTITNIFRKTGVNEQETLDRRVSAALYFWRETTEVRQSIDG